VPAAAAARHRRQCLHPDQTIKPVRGEPLTIPSPSPARNRSEPPEFGQPRRPPRPGDDIANPEIFPGSLLQKRNSNSKTLWLILVNCVENHRKIEKMQKKICWIRCELSYNFCYSGLS
jgi:hypothetical protein